MKLVVSALLVSLLISTAAYAENSETQLTLGDLVAKGATRLSKDDLQLLLTGAKVESIGLGGSTKYWENSVDGKFIASSDTRGKSAMGQPSTGQGTWHIADEGSYCIRIEWRMRTEEWCRFVYKDGGKYYGVNSNNSPATPAHALAFSK